MEIVRSNYLFGGENHKHLRILKWNEQTFEFLFVETTKKLLRRLVSNSRAITVSDAEIYLPVKVKEMIPIGTHGDDETVFVVRHEGQNDLFLIGVRGRNSV